MNTEAPAPMTADELATTDQMTRLCDDLMHLADQLRAEVQNETRLLAMNCDSIHATRVGVASISQKLDQLETAMKAENWIARVRHAYANGRIPRKFL